MAFYFVPHVSLYGSITDKTAYSTVFKPNVTAMCLAFLFHIWEILGSNLSLESELS
jgi:hypothetical protein